LYSASPGWFAPGWKRRVIFPPSRVTHTALSLWLTQALYLGLIAGFQFLANHSIKDALGRARRELDERRRTEEALRQARDELEARVRERTAELQTVNKELETFTYSVSHDLRSPLRTVNGFTDVLMEDYARDMPADTRQLLATIKASAERMGQLIQDLLNLSHIDRQPLSSQPVNLTSLVRETLEELRG
jgi:signal transduction histidine kinase